MKKVAVLGAGFAGLSAATCLARAGFDVTLLEKNDLPGGRIRRLHSSQVLRSRVRVPNRNKLAILGYSFVKHQLNLI